MAAEACQTAKTQRWTPEEFLRTLVEAEIAARDASNLRARLRQAGFPVTKTLEQFQVGLSSVPQQTFGYLASLEWLQARENPCLLGHGGRRRDHRQGSPRACCPSLNRQLIIRRYTSVL
jgi:DNA replication protein DnaC